MVSQLTRHFECISLYFIEVYMCYIPKFERKQCQCYVMYLIICLILQTINYIGNEKYVLVLVQCQDWIITNSINIFASYTRLRLVQDQTDLSRSS